MDSLAKEDNIRELEESLQRLPEDLDQTYDDALERIKHQDSQKRARADQVFTLISCAKRPLSLAEVRQALSIRSGDTFLDPRALPKAESLISACCGLVVIEGSGQTVRLVHYTTEEYFRRKWQRYRSPEAHRHVAGVLITYLSSTTFSTFSPDKMIEDLINRVATDGSVSSPRLIPYEELKEKAVNSYMNTLHSYMNTLLESNTLMQYAAQNWDHHARIAFTDLGYNPNPCLAIVDCHNRKKDDSWNLMQLIPAFLGKKPNVLCANEVVHHVKAKLGFLGYQVLSPTKVTELHIAASIGIICLVIYYLNLGVDIDAIDSEGMTALHKAAKNGHVGIVRLLLDSGAAIESLDRKGRSALAWSLRTNNVSVSELLLQRGSECGLKNVHGPGLSEVYFAATAGHDGKSELLANLETDNSRMDYLLGEALLRAALSKQECAVRLLMRGGKGWAISKQYQAKAMIIAASAGHVRLMEVLLEAGADVNARDSKGETAMVVLVKSLGAFRWDVSVSTVKDSVSIMQLLLERGADTAARDCQLNRTSLEWAVVHGYSTLVWLLHERGTFTAIQKNVMIYLTRLYNALYKEDHETIKQLHHEKGILELESIPELLLVYIPANEGYQDVVLTFLQLGAAIEARTAYGESALHLAAGKGHLEIVELLLHHGADINSKAASGDTPLVCAAKGGSFGAIKLLLEHGAHIDSLPGDSNKSTTTMTQALYAYSKIVSMLLKGEAEVNFRDVEAHGGRLLHIAARNERGCSQARKIKLRLKYGADLEARDDEGKTPLTTTVEENSLEALPFLIKRGANLEARDYNGETPLGAAVRNGTFPGVHVILEEGA